MVASQVLVVDTLDWTMKLYFLSASFTHNKDMWV